MCRTNFKIKPVKLELIRIKMSFMTIHFGGELAVQLRPVSIFNSFFVATFSFCFIPSLDDQKLFFNLLCPTIILYENIKLRCGCEEQGKRLYFSLKISLKTKLFYGKVSS